MLKKIGEIMPHTSLNTPVSFTHYHHGMKGDNAAQVQKNLVLWLSKESQIAAMRLASRLDENGGLSGASIGDGVAIFDWVSPKIDAPFIACVTLDKSIDSSAVDDKAIDIVLVLVSPDSQNTIHLQTLSRLTRMFRDLELIQKIRDAESCDALQSILCPVNHRLRAVA